jgi:hypothetical protein
VQNSHIPSNGARFLDVFARFCLGLFAPKYKLYRDHSVTGLLALFPRPMLVSTKPKNPRRFECLPSGNAARFLCSERTVGSGKLPLE